MTIRSISRSVLLISAVACGSHTSGPTFNRTPDLILYNADVHTMDPSAPHATAVALQGDRIVAVGSDDQIRALARDATKQRDLAGKTVIPGLIDAHCHLYGLGVDLEIISVRNLGSEEEVAKSLASHVKTSDGGWLIGRGWDQNKWPGQQFPTRASLDAVPGDLAILLRRIDGHAIWVNSKALAAAKITRDTKDPPGGKILRDDKGEPTGVLIDNAGDLVDAVVPAPSAQVRERRIRAAAKVAIEAGITGVHEMGIEDETADVYRKLAAANQLPLRVYAYLAGDPGKLDRVRVAPAPPVGWFAMRGVKYFIDGALGSRGARLYKEYDDEPGSRGLWVTEPDKLTGAVDAAVSGGWQVAIHAIGDAGIGAVLDAYLKAQGKHGGDLRLRVEHLQVLALADLPRLVDSKAIASMQPTHATSDMPWAEQRVGAERIKGAYAWRTVLDKGIPLAFGSDFPVEDVPPLLGIYAAVTRQDAKGNPAGGWYPDQKLTLDEAIAGFTRGAAYAEFAEDRGMIAAGKLADLTVFDRPLAPDRTLLDTHAVLTIVGGRVVYERGGK